MNIMLSPKETSILTLIPFERRDKRVLIEESKIFEVLVKTVMTTKEEVHQVVNSLWEKKLIGRMNGSGWYRPVIGMGTPPVSVKPEPKPYIPQRDYYCDFDEKEIIKSLGSPRAIESGLTMRELMESCTSGNSVSRGTVYNRLAVLKERGMITNRMVKRVESQHHNKSKRGKDFIQRRVLHVKAYFLVKTK